MGGAQRPLTLSRLRAMRSHSRSIVAFAPGMGLMSASCIVSSSGMPATCSEASRDPSACTTRCVAGSTSMPRVATADPFRDRSAKGRIRPSSARDLISGSALFLASWGRTSASISTLALATVSFVRVERTRKTPPVTETVPGPRKRTSPASWRARSWRFRNAGGPDPALPPTDFNSP
ncbi:hypothetical protein DTO57_01450 [Microbacterium sorbitolivorans]|uniref:Uncharacterized protein n=1 Tax=Microbacterium sorbitolivorans TaxID=1867410 RepID=A0A367Y646_9MICO|nr:hypothetical protein DTO57_01450 [Microbacterium sorbitolivorans]